MGDLRDSSLGALAQPPRTLQETEQALAAHLTAKLNGQTPEMLTVARVALAYLQWPQMTHALADFLPSHETPIGAINNMRQVITSSEFLIKRIKTTFGTLFGAYLGVMKTCRCRDLLIERHREIRQFKQVITAMEIDLPQDVKELF